MKKVLIMALIGMSGVCAVSTYAFTYQLRVVNRSGHTWLPYKDSSGVVSPVWEDESGQSRAFAPIDFRIPAGYERRYEKKDSGTISFVAYEQGHGNKIDKNVCQLVLDAGSVDFVNMHHCRLTTQASEGGIVYDLALTD